MHGQSLWRTRRVLHHAGCPISLPLLTQTALPSKLRKSRSVEALRWARPDLRARPESPQQGTERGRIGVAHLRRDLPDALRRRAQQMDGALGPQALHERERAHAERSLGPPLEGAPADPDRRRELPDIQRLAQAGAGLLLERNDQPVVVIEVVQGEVSAPGGA